MRRGRIGFAIRVSSAKNAASSTAATAPKPSVWAEPQPYSAAVTIA